MGRVALVTGGSMGLGLALVTALAEDGWTVIVDGRDPDDLASAVSGVPGPGRWSPWPGTSPTLATAPPSAPRSRPVVGASTP